MNALLPALNHPFSYDCNGKRLWLTGDNIKKVANAAASLLAKEPRLCPKEALSSPLVTPCRRFFKATRKYAHCEEMKKCAREFTAFTLGISAKTLSKNPDFEAFAKKSFLEQYLGAFDHTLTEDGEGHLSILHQGKMHPWNEVKEIAEKKGLPGDPETPKLYNPPLKYSNEGIENSSYYHWTQLKPFKVEANPSWGKRYVLEICTLASPRLRLSGDHTWTRLKTPDGEIYSFGIYREDNDFLSGFSMKKGKIQSPDVSEFWPEKIHTVSFEIDKASFEKVKAKVEKDKAEDRICFHVINQNCTTYAIDMAKLAGISLSVKASFASNFVPKRFYQILCYLMSFVPQVLYRMIRCLIAFLFNLILAILGGTKVSKTLAKEKVKPYFHSPLDLFKPSKLDGQFPSLLAFDLREKIERGTVKIENLL